MEILKLKKPNYVEVRNKKQEYLKRKVNEPGKTGRTKISATIIAE
jgi:hypothetical protein